MNLMPLTKQQKKAEQAAALARQYFVEKGGNCSESTLRGVLEALGLPVNDLLKKAATPFGGGIGHTRNICGALVGAEMALGTVVGRTDADQQRKYWAYGHAAHLHDAFVAEAGAEACRDLNPQAFDWPGLKEHCARWVEIAARLGAEEILKAQAERPA